MSEIEMLIELLERAPIGLETLGERFYKSAIKILADDLLENGVIVPSLKLGDKVWIIDRCYGYKTKSYEVSYIKHIKDYNGQLCYYSAIPFGKPISSIDFDDRDIGKNSIPNQRTGRESIERRCNK